MTVQADAASLERIFVNLITNTVKFSPIGSTVRVEADMTDLEVVTRVIDEGKGVAEQDREIIFERFQQGTRAKLEQASSGLGLSMVREYVGLHGGRVWVEDGPHGGAQFVFTLPRQSDETTGNSQSSV